MPMSSIKKLKKIKAIYKNKINFKKARKIEKITPCLIIILARGAILLRDEFINPLNLSG